VLIGFNTEDMMLRSMELRFADDSSMRNEFDNGVLNPVLDETLFEAGVPATFKVSEPLSTLKR